MVRQRAKTVTSEKVNVSSRLQGRSLGLATALVVLVGLSTGMASADDKKAEGAEAVILREAADPVILDLPSPPDVTVTVEAPAAEPTPPAASATAQAPAAETAPAATATPATAEADVVVPAAPDVELAEDLRAAPVPLHPAPLQKADAPSEPKAVEATSTGVASAEAAPAKPATPVVAEPKLDLPEPPTVVVSVESPKAPILTLPVDQAGIRALIEPARLRFKFKPAEADAIAAAYAERDFRPIWLQAQEGGAVVQARVGALSKFFSEAEQDGLDAVRLLSAMPIRVSGVIPAEKLAETDLAISVAAFLYARDARGGRLEPSRLSSLLTPELDLPQPTGLLAMIAELPADKLVDALARFNPPHEGYRALRGELAKLRKELSNPILTGSVAGLAGAPQPAGGLPAKWLEGAPLAFDKPDPRVPHLRIRLGLPAEGGDLYDRDVRKAVEGFQRVNGLKPDGRITPRTRAALENPQSPLTEADRKPDRNQLMATVIANMERWRWLPSDLGEFHVFVNVPDFKMKLMQDGHAVHETRVIVGKPQTQTPIFSDEMEHLIVNPSWGVPPSILKKEFLPKMATDPDYAKRRGFEVVRRGNSISIRQPPGERNALGFVKFIFPNSHSVYLHDTPNRSLFSQDFRAFSHGCVRVDKPFAFAEKLLSTSLGYSEPYLRGMVGRGERMIRLPRKIPVHLSYFTVFVDEDGKLQERRDLYGHDARMRAALQL